MKKIELIIRPEKLKDLKEILNAHQVYGLTVTMVSGCGNQQGKKELHLSKEFNMILLPKVKVETVVIDSIVNGLLKEITAKIKTGAVGDGKIFVYNVEEAVRIRTDEIGENAL